MEEPGHHPLHNFVTRVENMPHIHEKILDELDMYDMANCLKACKDLRQFVISGIKCSSWLQDDLDEEVSRLAATTYMTGPLERRVFQSLQTFGDLDHQAYRFGFGFDDSLWFTIDMSSKPEFRGKVVLNVYDMPSGTISNIIPTNLPPQTYRYRTNVRLLSKSRLLLADFNRVRVAARVGENGKKSYKIINESDPEVLGRTMYNDLAEQDGCLFGDDCIYTYTCTQSCAKQGENYCPYKFTFYSDEDDGKTVLCKSIKLPAKPNCMIRKDNFVMMEFGQDILMMDILKKKRLWTKADILSRIREDRKMILTETFCGYLYFDLEEDNVPYDHDGYDGLRATMGNYKLLLLDTKTGRKIFHEHFWSFLHTIIYPKNPSDYMPLVTAKGDYLFAYSPHDRDGPEGNDTIMDAFFCVHVDPNDLTCKARRLEGQLHKNLLEDCREYEHTEKPEDNLVCWKTDTPEVNIQPEHCGLLGFAFETVVIGYVTFDYIGKRAKYSMTKTLFSVELENFFNIEDCDGDFMGIHFPLGSSEVLANHGIKNGYWDYGPDYYPYYQTRGDDDWDVDAMMDGFVEVFLEPDGTITPTVYSFRKTFERKELPVLATKSDEEGENQS